MFDVQMTRLIYNFMLDLYEYPINAVSRQQSTYSSHVRADIWYGAGGKYRESAEVLVHFFLP